MPCSCPSLSRAAFPRSFEPFSRRSFRAETPSSSLHPPPPALCTHSPSPVSCLHISPFATKDPLGRALQDPTCSKHASRQVPGRADRCVRLPRLCGERWQVPSPDFTQTDTVTPETYAPVTPAPVEESVQTYVDTPIVTEYVKPTPAPRPKPSKSPFRKSNWFSSLKRRPRRRARRHPFLRRRHRQRRRPSRRSSM